MIRIVLLHVHVHKIRIHKPDTISIRVDIVFFGTKQDRYVISALDTGFIRSCYALLQKSWVTDTKENRYGYVLTIFCGACMAAH